MFHATICYGLRPQHVDAWLQKQSLPPFFEILVDNFLFLEGGPALARLEKFAGSAQLLFHGTSLNLGGRDPLSKPYLQALKVLVGRFRPVLVSDHLCFTSVGSHHSYDLLPIALNGASLAHVSLRIEQVQDALEMPIAVENVSRYIDYVSSTMSELAFIEELCRRTGCQALLDVNNLYVNGCNFGFDPWSSLRELGCSRVAYYHVAGHSEVADFLHDTHDRPVKTAVWELLSSAMDRFGDHPIVLEHDDEQAPLEALLEQGALGQVALGRRSSGQGPLACEALDEC